MYILEEYDNNLRKCLEEGFDVMDRTKVGARVLTGVMTKVDIQERFPLVTKRKIFWKSIVKEWLWMVSGSDRISDLQALGSGVWDFWVDKEFAEKNNLDETSIGYSYGPNLRHFGGDLNKDGISGGFDQLKFVINEIKTNPFSRRILINLWRPDVLDKCKLPPCMNQITFVVEPGKDGKPEWLNVNLHQRSGDSVAGLQNSNLIGGALYAYVIAQQTGLKPKTLTHFCDNFHIYHSHFDCVKEYLSRPRVPQPTIYINAKPTIDNYTIDDFEIIGYNPLPQIKIPIAV